MKVVISHKATRHYFAWLMFTLAINIPVASTSEIETKHQTQISQLLKAGAPVTRIYSPKEYEANVQNWALAQTPDGMIYVGNGDGVLEFDGVNWRLIPVSNNTLVRSLAIDPHTGRIYVGAVGEFGYLAPDSNGKMQYVSMVYRLAGKESVFADVWQTFYTPDGIIFSTFSRLFRVSDTKVESWTPEKDFHFSFKVGQRVFIREQGRGLLELIDGQLQLLPSGEFFADERVYGLIKSPNSDSELLIGSRTKGLFLHNGNSLQSYPTEIDTQLKRDLLYSALLLPDGRVALATLQGGLYLINSAGKWVGKLGRKTGLLDSSVTALMIDKEKGLWLTLSRGLARAEVDSSLSYFNEESGLIGDVISMTQYRGALHVGTGDGLFRQKPGPVPSFEAVNGVRNQTWEQLVFNEKLLVANYLGVFEITENSTKLIYQTDTAFAFLRDVKSNSRVLVGVRNGVVMLRHENGNWINEGRIPGIEDEVREFWQSSSGEIWINTYATGLIRLKPIEGNTPEIKRYGVAQGLPDQSGNGFAEFEGKLLVLTSEGIYLFDAVKDRFKPDVRFEKLFSDGRRPVFDLETDPERGLWLTTGKLNSRSNESGLVERLSDGNYAWRPEALSGMLVGEPNEIYREQSGILWLAGSEGLFRFDPASTKDYSLNFHVVLRQVSTGDGNILYAGSGTPARLSLPFTSNRLRFEFAGLSFDSVGLTQYQVRLEGADTEWSPWSLEAFKDYSNLWEGDYQLHLRAKNRYGTVAESIVYRFSILPPWYRSPLAYFCYIALLSLITWGLIHWRVGRLRMQKRLLRNQVEERTQQLATLNAVGREITATLDLDAVLESLYNNMNRMLDAKVFGIGLYHAEKGEIEFRLAMQNGQRYKPYSRRMEDKSQLAVWCVDHCEPVLIGDYPNEYQQYVEECDSTVHTLFDGSESRQPKSLLYVPIVLQEQVIGVLSVQSFATHAYRRQHLDLLQTLASYAAIAIDNGRAHADLLIAYETMQEVSVTDQLTGLKNRRFLALHFKEDVNKTLRDYANWEVGLKSEMPKESDHVFFLLDLDHFKQVNDTYGHAAGDCVLVEIKNLLTKVFRDSDFLIRWGGEEFLVITRFTKRSSAVVLAERIRSAIEQHKFDIGDGQIIKMTSSIGFTAFPFIPKQYKALTWEQVINIADYCLYVAKNNQRNAWVGVFSGEMTEGEKFLKCLTHSPENLLVDHDLEVVTSIPDEQEIKW